MSGHAWPEPIATESGDAGRAILKQLWQEADRVDAIVTDPDFLESLIRETGSTTSAPAGPRRVNIVAATELDGLKRPGWRCRVIDRVPPPDIVIFYSAGCSFPHGALVFVGGLARSGWTTYYRRPVVLHALRRRFDEMSAAAIPHFPVAFAAGVREQLSTGIIAHPPLDEPEQFGPEDLYRCILSAHFAAGPDGYDADAEASGLSLAVHQARAFERASDILERYGGVIIADAVGLGKTYIGLRLIERVIVAGGHAVVIVPAALRDAWERELGYLGAATAKRHRASSNDSVVADSDNLDLWIAEGGRVTLLSVESLGRRNFDTATHRGADLVLVDEAHNFRNPATRRYRELSDLVRHSKVALLTATPINNTLFDLQHLIDLFAAPGAFRHLGIGDYREVFRRAADGIGDIRPIVAACVLRRTRRFLRQRYGDVTIEDPNRHGRLSLRFPKRLPPVAVEYDLAGTYGDLLEGLEEWLEALAFPAVDPEPDDDPDSPAAPAAPPGALIKIILLKRLESSLEAFRATVVQQAAWCSTALRALDAGRVLTRPDYRASFRGPADDPGSQLAFFELMLPAPAVGPEGLAEFRAGLESDLALLSRIHATLVALGPEGDRKLGRLLQLIDGPLAGRKVLIFTEFKDTARYLHRQLSGRPFLAQIDSERARLGVERAGRAEVIERFAPRSNKVPEPPTRERVDILIATDVLSEGLNLQDASVVVSYDLPWNPVRLMQRIGRIDRLGAVHDVVELHHFVPAGHLDRLLGLMSRLQGKVQAIDAAIGLDAPVLAARGEPELTARRMRLLTAEPDGLTRLEDEIEGPLDPEEQVYIDGKQLLEGEDAPAHDQPVVTAVLYPATEAPIAVAYWRLDWGP
ncbi:MAG: DEAD/DEAH box helicase family protein, partial [Gemmatimonadetes bacterium]|nr:DEAD/DEAH box helicase family protein [Gemmatimonadota bacterium]NIR76541.1 DEAD/DEAH box helicase family protein [Candidatus Kutchimonas denitrificans]NIS03359.1 DEAD/DEAH box helicase family protein [Gemmatimonadota bacterium]NIT69220.1 DEAD/DEAH box helicase family protein [Gemmatimonadota bacterium]NIU54612.1 DEAD/DEAH box helicase family protein [Gemmatimonadota bacterium]